MQLFSRFKHNNTVYNVIGCSEFTSLNKGQICMKLCHPVMRLGSGGRWGVVPASEHQEILAALASLIRAHRSDMALKILNQELGDRP